MTDPAGLHKIAPCADCGAPATCLVAVPTDKVWCTPCLRKRHPYAFANEEDPAP